MQFSLKLADIPAGALGREIPVGTLSLATRRKICEAVAADFAEMHHDVRVAVVYVDLNADVFVFTTPEDVETRQMCVRVSGRLFENIFDPPKNDSAPPAETASAPAEPAPCDSAPAAGSSEPSEDAPPAADAASDPAPQPPAPVQAGAVPSTEI
jgi:hypothetical protein